MGMNGRRLFGLEDQTYTDSELGDGVQISAMIEAPVEEHNYQEAVGELSSATGSFESYLIGEEFLSFEGFGAHLQEIWRRICEAIQKAWNWFLGMFRRKAKETDYAKIQEFVDNNEFEATVSFYQISVEEYIQLTRRYMGIITALRGPLQSFLGLSEDQQASAETELPNLLAKYTELTTEAKEAMATKVQPTQITKEDFKQYFTPVAARKVEEAIIEMNSTANMLKNTVNGILTTNKDALEQNHNADINTFLKQLFSDVSSGGMFSPETFLGIEPVAKYNVIGQYFTTKQVSDAMGEESTSQEGLFDVFKKKSDKYFSESSEKIDKFSQAMTKEVWDLLQKMKPFLKKLVVDKLTDSNWTKDIKKAADVREKVESAIRFGIRNALDKDAKSVGHADVKLCAISKGVNHNKYTSAMGEQIPAKEVTSTLTTYSTNQIDLELHQYKDALVLRFWIDCGSIL